MLKVEVIEHSDFGQALDICAKMGAKSVAVVEEVIKLPSGRTLIKKVTPNMSLLGNDQKYLLDLIGEDESTTKVKHLDDEETLVLSPVQGELAPKQALFGFLVSLDGVLGNNTVPVKKSSRGWDVTQILPLRMVPTAIEDKDDLFRDYEFRVVDGDYSKYFVKRITNAEQINREVGGVTLPDYPDDNGFANKAVESLVALTFKITKDDLREFFMYEHGSKDLRRFSSVTLLRGNECSVNVDGTAYIEHRNIIGSNRINIDERRLGEEGSITFIWKIYQL